MGVPTFYMWSLKAYFRRGFFVAYSLVAAALNLGHVHLQYASPCVACKLIYGFGFAGARRAIEYAAKHCACNLSILKSS